MMFLFYLACGAKAPNDDANMECTSDTTELSVQLLLPEWIMETTLEGSRVHVEDAPDTGVFEALVDADGTLSLILLAGETRIWATKNTEGQCFRSDHIDLELFACQPQSVELTLMELEGC